MTNKKKQQQKDRKLKQLKIIGAILSLYLFVNLFFYITGRINNFTFWVSLIVIGILSWKVIPDLRLRIENTIV